MLFESAVSDTILILQSKRALIPLELKEHLLDVTHLWNCFIAAEKKHEISGRNRKSLACHNIKLLVMLQLVGDLHEMVSRIVEQQQAGSAVLAEDRKNRYRMPTDAEFSVLEGLVEVLKPLSYLTDALSGEKQVTASDVLPVMKHAESKLSAASTDSQFTNEMKQTIWNDLEARYSDAGVSEMLEFLHFLIRDLRMYLQNKDVK